MKIRSPGEQIQGEIERNVSELCGSNAADEPVVVSGPVIREVPHARK